MTTVEPRRDLDEIGRRGGEIFERVVKPTLALGTAWKYVAIALDTDDYEIAATSREAISTVHARNPSGEVWIMRTDGSPAFRMRSPRMQIIRDSL